MKWLKRLVIGLVALVVLCVGIGFVLPAEWEVTRTRTIAASPEAIHAIVGDWARWPEWSTFDKMDPTAEMTVGEDTTGVGATRTWTGDQGAGSQTILTSDPATGFAFELTMEGFEPLHGELTYEAVEGGTLVTWTDKGTNSNPVFRWFGMMMDGMLGTEFEASLANIDALATAAPVETPEEPSGE